MNKLRSLVISSFFLSQLLFSQAPDDSNGFLESLPKSLQPDILRELAAQSDMPDPKSYRGPRTTVEQLEFALEKIRYQLVEIEEELSDEDSFQSKRLKRYGEDFFTSFQSTFSPINAPNISSGYILDAGDVLTFQIIGGNSLAQKDTASLIIERDGSINIPELGKIFISGLNIEQASKLIEDRIQASFIGKKAYLTLSKVRDINILIIGSAKYPGLYTLNGNTTILGALNAAGGISSNGSYRNIIHKRSNEVIGKFDLYQVIIFGNTQFNTNLKDGDVIIVNPAISEVSITGGIGNESIYEILPNDSLQDLIDYAGGITSSGDESNIVIRSNSIKNSGKKTIQKSDFRDFRPSNGDSIHVRSFKPKPNPILQINISGQVANPGTYTMNEGERLSDLILKAGGYTDLAYPFGGKLFRESAKKMEGQIFEKLYRDLIIYLLSSVQSSQFGQPFTVTNNLPNLLLDFKDIKPQGRVTTEFNIEKIVNNNSLDIYLEDGDDIEIPMYRSEVYIYGEVQQPGVKIYNPEWQSSDYIELAGGYGRFASEEKVIIIHPNGDTYLMSDRKLFSQNRIDIYPGSIIYIPRQIGKIDGINYASAIAPIFSSLALSIASLSAINN